MRKGRTGRRGERLRMHELRQGLVYEKENDEDVVTYDSMIEAKILAFD